MRSTDPGCPFGSGMRTRNLTVWAAVQGVRQRAVQRVPRAVRHGEAGLDGTEEVGHRVPVPPREPHQQSALSYAGVWLRLRLQERRCYQADNGYIKRDSLAAVFTVRFFKRRQNLCLTSHGSLPGFASMRPQFKRQMTNSANMCLPIAIENGPYT